MIEISRSRERLVRSFWFVFVCSNYRPLQIARTADALPAHPRAMNPRPSLHSPTSILGHHPTIVNLDIFHLIALDLRKIIMSRLISPTVSWWTLSALRFHKAFSDGLENSTMVFSKRTTLGKSNKFDHWVANGDSDKVSRPMKDASVTTSKLDRITRKL